MAYKPIDTLTETIAAGNRCAICGQPALRVIHVTDFPDYVECSSCKSAFILAEDGEHVLYGKIHPDFPETREIALKQWMILAAVQQVAELERPQPEVEKPETPVIPAAKPSPVEPEIDKIEPPAPEPQQPSEPAPMPLETPQPQAEEIPDRTPKIFDSEKTPVKPDSGKSFSALWKEEPLPSPGLLHPKDNKKEKMPPAAEKPEPVFVQEPDEVVPEEPGRPPVPAASEAQVKKPAAASESYPQKTDLERAPVFIPHSMESRQPPGVPEEIAPPQEIPEAPAVDAKILEKGQPQEPEPGIRYRVVLSGSQIKFPYKVCSHCMTSPASSSLSLTAFLPNSEDSTQRVPTPIRIPLCSRCRKRASAQSEAENTQRSRAFLYSAGSSLLLILLLLITGIPGRVGSFFIGSFLILITASIGFGIPLLILLEQSSKFPPPADAFYVLSTLFLAPSPPQDLTIFDWRNRGYAELFHLANRTSTVKSVHQVEDQGPLLPPKPPTPEPSAEQQGQMPPDALKNTEESQPEDTGNLS